MSLSGYGKDPYGFGPYGSINGVIVTPPNPVGAGYGGAPYGFGPYGSIGFAQPNLPIDGGYGGKPYGLSSYGCIGADPPKVINAISLTGFKIEVFFNRDMLPDAALVDPGSYTLIDLAGAAPATVLSVETGVPGTFGPTSVILNHTGTTLGGLYEVVVVGPQGANGGGNVEANAPCNRATVLTKGEPPAFTVTPLSGTELLYEFDQDMLPEVDFTPGIEELAAYVFESTYPVPILPQAVTFPFNAQNNQVKLDVLGMTSAQYTAVVGPSEAIIYDPTVLPGQDPSFISQEIGSGTSKVQNGKLLLSTEVGFSYGFRFGDLSGRLLPNSSFRVDTTIDFTAVGGVFPPLGDTTFFTVLVSDGAVGVTLTLKRVLGMDFIEAQSGAFFASGAASWSSGPTTISLVRNQKADTYTVVVNDDPFVAAPTASLNGAPGIPAGIQFIVDPLGLYNVVDFPLLGIRFTATQTVFSAAWNFLHQQMAPFVGNAGQTKDFILTSKGPLVKGWGDAQPATVNDVQVRVNGVEVDVESVNPYIGKITPTIPIPLLPAGLLTVEVDYIWFYKPMFTFAGLNTEGLVLNKVGPLPSLCPNPNDVVAPSFAIGGGIDTSRFAYGLALNTRSPRQPKLRSPRFVAFQKSYTAALNSPTTLLLNQNPHTVALPDEERAPEGEIVFYEGDVFPTDASPPWIKVGESSDPIQDPFVGTDLDIFEGETILLLKGELDSGPFGSGNPFFFQRQVDFSFNSSFTYVTRFQVSDEVPLMTDGVFTGVGFGVSTNNHLYLVGCLLVNGLQHIGMLVDPGFPEKVESWKLAYGVSIDIRDSLTLVVQTSDLPLFLQEQVRCEIDTRFQILSGTQEGVYQVVQVVNQTDGTSTITLSPNTPFPNDPHIFGNSNFTVYFETKWDGNGRSFNSSTYRLIVKNDIKECPEGRAELFIGGSLSGKALELEGAPSFAIPPDGVLLYPTGEEGLVFWGSLSRRASNASLWNFVRYSLEPAQTTINFRGIVAAAEMATLPENDPNNIWFLTQEFGFREIDINPGDPRLLLKATSADNTAELVGQDLTIGYARVEPFLNRYLTIDVDAKFQVDSGTLGAGDAEVLIRDGTRQVLLATILYQETATDRQLLSLPSVSLSGLLLPDQQGWVLTGSLTGARVQGQRLQFSQNMGEQAIYEFDLLQEFGSFPGNGRIFEARFKVESLATTDPLGDTGIYFGTDVGDVLSSRGVGLQLRTPVGADPARVFLFSIETGTEIVAFDFDWQDGEYHIYRVICDDDTDTVTLVVDDTVLGVTQLSLFDFSVSSALGALAFSNPLTQAAVEMESLSVVVLPPATAKRTLGVWLGGDKDDIDRWELPRTDSSSVPNSDLTATIEEFDWRSPLRVRIRRDPQWGVTILRPDLPPPPFFVGNQFASQITEPSAGWINVEYRFLPPVVDEDQFGYVSFGALEPESITQQRWSQVRYRIYRYASEDIVAPQYMVLNRGNVITSGEFQKDVTVETAVVISTDSSTIKVSDSNIFADRVFSISYVNSQGETVVFEPPAIEFDPETQTIKIVSFQNLAYQPSQDLADAEEEGVFNPSLNDENWVFENPQNIFVPDNFNAGSLTDFEFSPNPPFLPDPVRVPVTINFAPGLPLTTTYICSQPLLDGTTLLNDGTPTYTKSLIGRALRDVVFGSKVNDPNDTLNNDPDFILNDPYRSVEFSCPKNAEYEQVDFCEVSEGEQCLLSVFCDDNVPGASCLPGAPGSGSQPGDIGNGLISVGFGGLAFTETQPITFSDGPTGPFNQPLPSTFLMASGGDAPPGGNLQEAIIFTPVSPNSPTSPGSDGKVGWSVFGALYDTVTNTTTMLYFNSQGSP